MATDTTVTAHVWEYMTMAKRYYGLYRKGNAGKYRRVQTSSAYILTEARRVWQDQLIMGATGADQPHELRPVPAAENEARQRVSQEWGMDGW